MILYSENQLDDAWHYDCKIRSSLGANWISRGQYERLFVHYMQCLAEGDEFIKLDIHIPDEFLNTIGDRIELESDEEVH